MEGGALEAPLSLNVIIVQFTLKYLFNLGKHIFFEGKSVFFLQFQ